MYNLITSKVDRLQMWNMNFFYWYNKGFKLKTLGFMSSSLSFASLLHNIWMKIVASYAPNIWRFPTFVTDCVPHPPLPHFCLPTTKASLPFCRDWWFLAFCLEFTKQGKQRAESGVREAKFSNRCFPCVLANSSCALWVSYPKVNISILTIIMPKI